MQITFQSSKGDTFENCLHPSSAENEKFVEGLLATDLIDWQCDYCENQFFLFDETDSIKQSLDLYRDENLGYFLRWIVRYGPIKPMRILYAWNESQPVDEVAAVHLIGGGMVYPAQLFHPKETVKNVLLDFAEFPEPEEKNLGSIPWIGTDCLSGKITHDPPFEHYMRFTIDYETLKKH